MSTPSAGENSGAADTDQILHTGLALLIDLIWDRVRRHATEDVTVTYAQLGGTELRDPEDRELALGIRLMVDDLDGTVASMINRAAIQPTNEVFIQVASLLFADGKFNWGRVVTLFYFASVLVIKEGIKSCFATSQWKTAGVILASVLSAVFVLRKM